MSKFVCRSVLLCFLFTVFAIRAGAQEPDNGRLSGSFETNTIWYVDDKTDAPDDRLRSNNYLKLDYTRGKFSAGGQYELYAPVLLGFDSGYKGGKITNKFASWTDNNFSVTVGDFYEQFGSGLILRSYEDRALGFNNSLEGVRATYNFGSVFSVRGLWARPRLLMSYAPTWIRGADASLSLSSIFGMDSDYIAVEGSYVSRYEYITDPNNILAGPNNMGAWSGRLILDSRTGLSLRAELVGKGEDVFINDDSGEYEALKGNAQLVELGYNNHGLGIFATYRRLDHMDMMLMQVSSAPESQSMSNVLNYLPSLTRQYSYLLTNLNPHVVKGIGEQGGQIDVFYNFRKGSKLGGSHGMKVHANAAMFYSLEKHDGEQYLLFRDVSFDVERQWNRKLKTTFLVSVQSYRPQDDDASALYVSNIFVADVLYKFTPKHSLRAELQYLYSAEGTREWVAALAEYSFAPRFSVFASEMYNYGGDKTHYYNVGASYARSRTRIALSYGRNREGFICSGGVCKLMPAYTGANLTITSSF